MVCSCLPASFTPLLVCICLRYYSGETLICNFLESRSSLPEEASTQQPACCAPAQLQPAYREPHLKTLLVPGMDLPLKVASTVLAASWLENSRKPYPRLIWVDLLRIILTLTRLPVPSCTQGRQLVSDLHWKKSPPNTFLAPFPLSVLYN